MLVVETVPLHDVSFASQGSWAANALSEEHAAELCVKYIGVVSSQQRHPLEMCNLYERIWRVVAPEIIRTIQQGFRHCYVWAHGPFEWDCLPRIIRYMVGDDPSPSRFYIPELRSDSESGFITGWVSFAYSSELFSELLGDTDLDLERTSLLLVLSDADKLSSLRVKPPWEIQLQWCIDSSSLVVSFSPHFEGCYLIGRAEQIQDALDRLSQALPGLIDACEKQERTT